MNSFGKKIKLLRIEKGITQKQLASIIGVEYQYISRWERGVQPSSKYIAILSDALDADLSELCSASESKDISKESKSDQENDLTQNVTRCVEQALANDPRLRLMDSRLEEILSRLEKLEKGLKDISAPID